MAANPLQAIPSAELSPEIHRPADDRQVALTRLSFIHAEAVENARLANLLGRSLWVSLALPVLAAVTIAVSDTPLAQRVSWSVLVLAGAAAILSIYGNAIAAPFERENLKSFANNLNASMLYAGFAWGGGAFLALRGDTSPAFAILFSAGAAALAAAILREREPILFFAAPVAVLTASAAMLRPLAVAPVSAALVVLATLFVAAALFLSERLRHGEDSIAAGAVTQSRVA